MTRVEARWRLGLAVLAGVAVAGVAGYRIVETTLILPRSIEWLEAYSNAQNLAVSRLSRTDFSRTALPSIKDLHECFPTESEWFWGRFRWSVEELNRRSQDQLMQCLQDAVKVRGWKPPKPET